MFKLSTDMTLLWKCIDPGSNYFTFKVASILLAAEKLFRFMTLFPLSAGEPLPFSLPPPSTASAEAGREKDRVYTVNCVHYILQHVHTIQLWHTLSCRSSHSSSYLWLPSSSCWWLVLLQTQPSLAVGVSHTLHTQHTAQAAVHTALKRFALWISSCPLYSHCIHT